VPPIGTDENKLLYVLEEARKGRFATNNQEFLKGVCASAVPIFKNNEFCN
jgi:DNA-binding IclR family transcriptional regulator